MRSQRNPKAIPSSQGKPAHALRAEVALLVERISRIILENKSGARKAALIVERWISKRSP